MRVVIQRVSSASVTINGEIHGRIGRGLLLLLGIEADDNQEDVQWLSGKIIRLRIFPDDAGLMNRSIQDIDGEILLISQFTLFANTKKGNRPSFLRSAKPDIAIPIYQTFQKHLEHHLGKSVATGQFGAYMEVRLVNDGPVTISIDTKAKE